jgi:diacylglycerol kinase family enzyme
MLNALLIGNTASAAGDQLSSVKVPGRWILDPASVTPEDLEGVDLVAIFGGDGTMQMTLSQILSDITCNALPPVAVMPFGTTNMNALGLNQSRGRKATVTSLERAITSADLRIQNRPLVRVQDGGETRFGFFFGAGIIATVVERWNVERSSGQFANQLRSLIAMINGLRSASAATEVVLDGCSVSIYALFATTLDRLIFGTRPFWGDEDQGALRLTWIERDAPQLVKHIPGLLRGRPHMAAVPGYESLTTESLTLQLKSPYIVDGEIFHSTSGHLTVEQSDPVRWVVL